MISGRRIAVLVLAGALWLAGVGWGLNLLFRYSGTPGDPGRAPESWPAATAIHPAARGATLVLTLHPHCPCSRATLDELDWIMARTGDRLTTVALFVIPPGLDEHWGRSDLWARAGAIPRTTPVLDPEGREARYFGAFTSGQVALYAPGGRLLFQGGLTDGRGEGGASVGRQAVLAAVTSGTPNLTTATYGCPLHDPASTHSWKAASCQKPR